MLRSFTLLALCGFAAADWAEVDALISKFRFLANVSFTAGDTSGRRHTFTKGYLTMDTPVILASSSKFPAAIAIAGAVADGHLSFDTAVHEVFDWWTKEPDDVRSHVTLRHLLTFTSGLVSDDFGGVGMQCLNISNVSQASKIPFLNCTREIYDTGPWTSRPGTIWSYHSLHLQIAGAMAATAAKLTVQQLLRKYLLDKLGMSSSHWIGNQRGTNDPNPHLAAALMSTGADYDKLLQAVLDYSAADQATIDEIETDAYRTYPGLVPAQNLKDRGLGFYGHYSVCIYFECVNQPWSEECEQRGIHADPGALGYWPLIHRSKGYYMQLVVAQRVELPLDILKKFKVTRALLAALPAECVSPLRFSLTEPVEEALGLNASKPIPTPPLPFPVPELCKLASSNMHLPEDGFGASV